MGNSVVDINCVFDTNCKDRHAKGARDRGPPPCGQGLLPEMAVDRDCSSSHLPTLLPHNHSNAGEGGQAAPWKWCRGNWLLRQLLLAAAPASPTLLPMIWGGGQERQNS